jgi:hypothetical protein
MRHRPAMAFDTSPHVMAGLIPAIHAFLTASRSKAWMPGTYAKTRFAL